MAALFSLSPRSELRHRLDRLARVFPIQPIVDRTMGAAEVVEYYEHCFDAYRRHHSVEGALHMALNEGGRFDAAGFDGQWRRLQARWQSAGPQRVLELAFGQGFNLVRLAEAMPGTRFDGLDLTPLHVDHVRARIAEHGLDHVQVRQGDFHRLPYDDTSFDHVFCIEAFCYAGDTPRALAEVARVLRPGGTLTLFDGYQSRPLEGLPADDALAVQLVAKGMALERFQVVGEFLAQAAAAGFELQSASALEPQILPSLRRLERLTGAVVRWPWLGRRALARRHPMRGRNVLAGYLMHSCVTLGLLVYREFVLCRCA